jgi:hypothetical protein
MEERHRHKRTGSHCEPAFPYTLMKIGYRLTLKDQCQKLPTEGEKAGDLTQSHTLGYGYTMDLSLFIEI